MWIDRIATSRLTSNAPIFVLSMVLPHTPLAPPLESQMARGISWRVAILWFLATPMQLIFGMRFYVSAFAALRHCVTNMDTLVALGTTVVTGRPKDLEKFWNERSGLTVEDPFHVASLVASACVSPMLSRN